MHMAKNKQKKNTRDAEERFWSEFFLSVDSNIRASGYVVFWKVVV